jgi:vitamin B12 transporter
MIRSKLNACLFAGSALSALVLTQPAYADEALDQVASRPDVAGVGVVSSLPDVVVTANRTAQPVERVGASVTVLTGEAIEQRQATSALELLASTPGVSFTRNGGVGTAAGLYIRGAESHHSVVLVDGVKLNDPALTQGYYNFGNMLVGDAGRIEVLRGAQSTLWGSQAVGGVVNILTREPSERFEGNLSAEAGSRGTRYVRGGVGGANERLTWRLGAGRYDTDGLSAFAGAPEKDGFGSTSLSGRVNLKLTEALSLDLRSVWSDSESDFDAWNGDSREFTQTEEGVVYAGLNLDLLDGRFLSRLAYAQTDVDRANYDPDFDTKTATYQASGQNRRWEYQGSLAFTNALNATFGFENERQEMVTRSLSAWTPVAEYERGEAELKSAYSQVQWTAVPGLTLTAGVRYDDHSEYGDDLLGQLAGVWGLNEGRTLLRASWGQGFRAPGPYELYSQYGNRALQAESFDSWEVGIEQRLSDTLRVSATAFLREADNEIRYNGCSLGTTDPLCTVNGVGRWGYYHNVQKTRTQGLELIAQARLSERLNLNANYSWTEAKSASGPTDGRFLTRRPEHLANLSLDYGFENGVKTGLSLRYVGDSFDDADNARVIEAYSLVDLRLSYPVNDQLEVYGRIENLFDETYSSVPNYGTAGQSAFGGVRIRF